MALGEAAGEADRRGVPAGACPPSVHDIGMGNTAKGLWTMERVERLGRYVLLQAEGVFPLGADTLDLSRFATVRRGFRVCDLGCGSGALGLLLLEREEKLELTGVEVEPAAAELARRNLALNGLCGQVLTGDLRDRALLPSGYFDLVVSNPPWFQEGGGYSGGPARCEERCSMEQLCAAAGRLVKNGGRAALVHRPERLPELFAQLRAVSLEPKRMRLVQHSPDAPPSAVLVEAVRQGRPGLEVLPVLLRTERVK